jgi:hypothetical protein
MRGKAAATVQLEQAILEIVDERAPITVRGVCYALFALRGMIPDMSVGSTQKVSRIMTEMRETGTLDWRLIVDGSRTIRRVALWRDPSAIIKRAVESYRRDNWQDQPAIVEVWSEKSTVEGVLEPVLDALGVAFRVLKGFGSFTSIMQAAADSAMLAQDRNAIVLYVGDWDPKRKDPRHLWFVERHGQRCWELDAMNPNDLRRRVRAEIEACIDWGLWDRSRSAEKGEIASMKDFHQAWRGLLKGRR